MMKSAPFARVRHMMNLIAAAMSLSAAAQQIALNQIGPYVSRGKGEGGRFLGTSRNTVAGAKRAALKTRNRARNKAHHRG